MENKLNDLTICVIGLGYVGFPLALAFSKHFNVVGFDSSSKKIDELKPYNSETFSIRNDDSGICEADINVIAVPTPVDRHKDPDLGCILSAAQSIGKNLKKGCTVVLESSVYPGTTEEIVVPEIEKFGWKCGLDFKVGYSPERINPGDPEHGVDKITKLVSGQDDETTSLLKYVYSKVCQRVHVTRNIKTAEAAKIIENTQRDINIALCNELSMIFARMGIHSDEVLDAAATKWNFARYSPGLVGGHCIPVDPYYLVYKARELGYHSQVILAGREINDSMPQYVAQQAIRLINDRSRLIKGSKVLIMGLTYKENVPDIRETPSKEIIKELSEYGVDIFAHDPLVDDIPGQFGVKPVSDIRALSGLDCVIITVKHSNFNPYTLADMKAIMKPGPVLVDVRGLFPREEARNEGFSYFSL
ncbi:nucleotide sugar dehydrogenase [Dehalogenimonas etheniformans]|uniref:nucleotide sugar dehydrogenase n=1 Tax=Dehalogenimonas etheniformans TaxID=1536648 RepID=UPI001D00CEDA|nr:nucleotide sugar dehydrogenase [Dehalogenimonas etheniformans]